MKVTFRRNLKPPTLPVDNGATGYTVQFKRVRIGCVFKVAGKWYIKKTEDHATVNGTATSWSFSPTIPVWITSMEHTKPVAKWTGSI